jgi:hypothetical protein
MVEEALRYAKNDKLIQSRLVPVKSLTEGSYENSATKVLA